MNLAKLNYILIPSTKEERERFRSSRSGAFFRFLVRMYFLFSREGHVLLFFWMMASAISINIGFTQYYVVWSILSGLLLASLLVRRSVALDEVQVSLSGPPRVSLGDEVHFTLAFRNHSDRVHQAMRIERPFLPWDGKYLGPRPTVDILEPGQTVRTVIKACFIARGEHVLDPVSVRALAPLGLALGPHIQSEGLQFLVIPKIAKVTHVDVETTMKYQPGGVALASISGEAQELIGVRPYRPGDPIRDLHAKTWARIGEPAVREYQQEYFTRIGIVIDTEGGVSDEPLFEAMLSLAAGIVAQLSRGEALLDLLVIGDDIHQLTLGRSLGFLEQALDLLACVEPKEAFRVQSLQSQISEHLTRLSCVLILSLQWDEAREQFTHWIEHQGIRCRRIAVWDKKPLEYAKKVGVTLIEAADVDKELVV